MVSHYPGFICTLVKAELHAAAGEYLICQLPLAQVFRFSGSLVSIIISGL